MDWKILAIIVPLTFVGYQSLSKLLPKTVSLYLVNAYAAIFGIILMLALHLMTSPNKSLAVNSKTLPLIIGIGVLISLGNFGVIKAFSLGAPQSLFSVIFYVTLLIYGVLFGILIWKETLNLPQIFGAILSVFGIAIIFYFKNR